MTKRIIRIIHPLLVPLAALALAACAGVGGDSDPDRLRVAEDEVVSAEPNADSPNADAATDSAAASAGAVVAVQPTPAVAQWRPWMNTEVERLRTERPTYFDQVMALPARTTRAGFPRFSGPLLREPDAAPILLYRLLSGNETVELRAALVEALPRTTGDFSAALAELMESETDARVRELIAASLHRAQAPYALQGLALGAADINPRVRAESLRTIGRRKDGAELLSTLVVSLGDPEEVVQIEAARALGNLEVSSTEVKEALAGQLSASSAALRRHSLRALSRIDAEHARALPQLEALRSDSDPKVARVAESIASAD